MATGWSSRIEQMEEAMIQNLGKLRGIKRVPLYQCWHADICFWRKACKEAARHTQSKACLDNCHEMLGIDRRCVVVGYREVRAGREER